MTWEEFARALEEGFRREGYAVKRAEGAADFELEKAGRVSLVCARRWKASVTGVEPLKELVFGEPVTPSLLSSLSNKIKLFCTVYDPTTDKYRFDYSIFMGLFIGASSIGIVSFLVLREWRHTRRRRRG